jgi:hypothetical protein
MAGVGDFKALLRDLVFVLIIIHSIFTAFAGLVITPGSLFSIKPNSVIISFNGPALFRV